MNIIKKIYSFFKEDSITSSEINEKSNNNLMENNQFKLNNIETDLSPIVLANNNMKEKIEVVKKTGLRPIFTWVKGRPLSVYINSTFALEFFSIVASGIALVWIIIFYRASLVACVQNTSILIGQLANEQAQKQAALSEARRHEMLCTIIDAKRTEAKMAVLDCNVKLNDSVQKSLSLYNENVALKNQLRKAEESALKMLKNK